MKIRLLRHATMVVEMKGLRLLIDPMLSRASTMDPSQNTIPQLKNPLVELPEGIDLQSLKTVDAMLITHTHRDHFDDAAVRLLPDTLPVFCQPEDVQTIMDAGFTHVTAVHDTLTWNGLRVSRTSGRHGRGEMADKMGPVSGFVLEAKQQPSLYITGDTVWCKEVEDACRAFNPEVIVAFGGGAEFTSGGPITMTPDDIHTLSDAAPNSRIVVAHMESWNHCLVSRKELREFLHRRGVHPEVLIPSDGEILEFNS